MRTPVVLLTVAVLLAVGAAWWFTQDAGDQDADRLERHEEALRTGEARTEDPTLAGSPAASRSPRPAMAPPVEDDTSVPRRRILAGRVVDVHRQPVRRAVAWLNVDTEAWDWPHAVTAEDGSFRLLVPAEVPSGEHLFCAKSADDRCAYFRLVVPDCDAEHDLGDVVIQAGASIGGRVLDAAGEPLPRLRVKAFVEAGLAVEISYLGAEVRLGMAEAVTNARGEFTLSGLAPVPHQVHVDLSMRPTDVAVPAGSSGVRPGDPSLRFVVRPETVVRGRVLDAATGRPIPVFVVDGTTVHETDGRFEIGLPENGTIDVGSKGYRPSSREGLGPVAGRVIDLLDIRLEPDPDVGSVRVVVRDPAGARLTGWMVRTTDDAFLEWTTRAGSRSEVLVDGLRAGPVGVLVWGEGLSLAFVRTEVEIGQERTLEVTLHRGGTVRFEILDEDGVAPAGVDVSVLDLDGTPQWARWTYDEPQGALLGTVEDLGDGPPRTLARLEGRLDGLAAGRYVLRIQRAIGHLDVAFEVPEAGSREVKTRLGEETGAR